MPNPVSFLANFITGLVSAISGAKQLASIAGAINNSIKWLTQIIGDLAATITWAGLRTNAAWDHVLHPAFTDGSARLEYASRAHNYALNWIVDVIIPASVKTGTHRVYVKGVYPLRKQVQTLTSNLAELEYDVNHLPSNPQFRLPPWWQIPKGTGYQLTLTVQNWIKNPGQLSGLLAATMTGDVVKQLGYGKQSKNLDRLAGLLAGALQHVTTALDTGLVAWLNSGSY